MKTVLKTSGAVMLVCLFVLTACQGKSGTQAGTTLTSLVASKERTATVLSSKVTLWAEADGVMNPKSSANLGDIVVWKDKTKAALRSTDKAERTFCLVKVDKADVWIQDVFIAPDSKPGVIVGGDAVLYKKPDITAPSGMTIPKDTIVGVHVDSEQSGFTAISAYLEGAKAPVISRMYVKSSFVTVDEKDVQAMKLIVLAQNEKNDVVKKELLKNAQSLGSVYGSLISRELHAIDPNEPIVGDDSDVEDSEVELEESEGVSD